MNLLEIKTGHYFNSINTELPCKFTVKWKKFIDQRKKIWHLFLSIDCERISWFWELSPLTNCKLHNFLISTGAVLTLFRLSFEFFHITGTIMKALQQHSLKIFQTHKLSSKLVGQKELKHCAGTTRNNTAKNVKLLSNGKI